MKTQEGPGRPLEGPGRPLNVFLMVRGHKRPLKASMGLLESRRRSGGKTAGVFLFFSLFLLRAAASAESLYQLIYDARTLLSETTLQTQRAFTDDQIKNFLNEGQRQAINSNDCLMQSTTFQLSAGTTFYALPSGYVSIARVTRGGISLTELTPAALDGRSRGWESASGLPVYYFTDFSSRSMIGFSPFPLTTSDTDTIKVEFNVNAPDMSALTDSPFAGISELTGYHGALAYYAAAIMASTSGNPSLGTALMQVFLNDLSVMKSRCRERPNYLPSAVGIP